VTGVLPAGDGVLSRPTAATQPIGVFDSGVGGLSVVRHLRDQLPGQDILFVADQAHIPYGFRATEEIAAFSRAITRFLLDRGAKLIVVACNTATAAAVDTLRAEFPDTPFVGMEPALKPAAAQTHTGRIGVLATPGTFASPRYATLMDRFARQVTVYEDPCLGLVSQIEAGETAAPETERILRAATEPMLAAGVDTLVLGCTHYPFVLPLLRSIVGDGVVIIDPAPAVARHAAHVLQQHQLSAHPAHQGTLTCYTSGDPERFAQLAALLLGQTCPVLPLHWVAGDLRTQTTQTHRYS
jgi:glutamate racemase